MRDGEETTINYVWKQVDPDIAPDVELDRDTAIMDYMTRVATRVNGPIWIHPGEMRKLWESAYRIGAEAGRQKELATAKVAKPKKKKVVVSK